MWHPMGLASLAVAATLLLGGSAFAQDEQAAEGEAAARAAEEPAARQGGVEEIIVTATKREANIQDIPIAVSAFQGDELTARGIDEVEDLEEISPSLQINTSNSASNGGTMRIRGMGTTGNNPGLEAAVGSYVDGVYRARAGQGFGDLLDIERVEILRGPQGTLFGKNTSAGAVHIITKKPNLEEQEGFVQLEYGNYDHKRVAISHSAPIVEGLLGYRVAASWNDRDGFYEDVHSSDAWGDRDRYQLRGQLLWAPQDNFDARLIADYGQRDESCCPAQIVFAGPTSSRLTGGGSGNGVKQLAELLGLGRDIPGIGSPITFPATGCAGLGTPTLPSLGLPACTGSYPFARVSRKENDDREVGLNYEPFEKVQDWGISLEMNWDLDRATITSITAYRDFHARYGEDVDYTSADILRPQQGLDDIFRNASEEIRLVGTWENLDWLVGGYAYKEDIHSDERLEFGSQAGMFVFGQTSAAIGALPAGAGYSARWDTESEGYALFTNNTYHLTDAWSITIGARYSREEKQAQGVVNDSPFAVINGVATGYIVGGGTTPSGLNDSVSGLIPGGNGWCEDLTDTPGLGGVRLVLRGFCDNASWKNEATEREWTGTGSMSYAITDDINVYATVSRGYKAGGFNLDQESVDVIVGATGVVSTTAGNIETAPGVLGIQDESRFEPEFSTSYEIGIKGVYLDGMARINIAGFITKYDDFQLNTFNGLGFIISNVSQVESRGFELESYLYPLDGVQITFGVTYADTRYGDNINLCFPIQYPDGSTNNCEDNNTTGIPGGNDRGPQAPFAEDFFADGNRITNSPAWSGNLSLSGERPLPSTEWTGYFGTSLRYTGRHNTGSNLHPLKVEKRHYFLNANAGVRSPDGHWDASLWAKNLTNEYERTVLFDSVFQGGSQHTFFNEPRMYGGTIKYNF